MSDDENDQEQREEADHPDVAAPAVQAAAIAAEPALQAAAVAIGADAVMAEAAEVHEVSPALQLVSIPVVICREQA